MGNDILALAWAVDLPPLPHASGKTHLRGLRRRPPPPSASELACESKTTATMYVCMGVSAAVSQLRCWESPSPPDLGKGVPEGALSQIGGFSRLVEVVVPDWHIFQIGLFGEVP